MSDLLLTSSETRDGRSRFGTLWFPGRVLAAHALTVSWWRVSVSLSVAVRIWVRGR